MADTNLNKSMYVAKGNALIQKSRYSLSLMEQKAILYAISKIKPNDALDSEYTFDIREFCKTCSLYDDGGFYQHYLQKLMMQLGTHVVRIDAGQGRIILTHWFSSVVIDTETKKFQISFDKNIRPYLFELKSFYTQYSLKYVLPMKSKYGIRLYELLKSVQSLKREKKFELDELKELIDSAAYPIYKDFRIKVLEPAMRDVNLYSDIYVKAIPRKTGRKVTHIEFEITPCDAMP